MDQDQKKEFLKICKEQHDEITHIILQLEEQVKPIAPDAGLGRLTRMDAIQAKSINESTLRDLKTKKFKIEYNISHVDDSNFGNCRNCGKTIAPARLAYLPETDLCINCA